MKGKSDDLGFIVVPNPKAGQFNWFNWFYPKWFKVKQIPNTLMIMLRKEIRSVNNPVIQYRKFN